MKIPEASFDYAHIVKTGLDTSVSQDSSLRWGQYLHKEWFCGDLFKLLQTPYFSIISLDFCLMSSLANYSYLYVVF